MKIVKSENGNYSVKYKDSSGNPRSSFLRTKDKKEATEMVKALRIEELETAGRLNILSNEVISKIVGGKSVKFWDVVEEYIEHMRMSASSENSIYTMKTIYEQFAKSYKIKEAPIGLVTDKMIHAYLNAKDGTSISNRALRKSSLRQLWNFAMIKTYVLSNPLMFIKIDKSKLKHEQKTSKERQIFYKREVDKIIRHAPYFFRQATALSYWAGFRLGDIASLEWASIKNRDKIQVWTEKRDKLVTIDTKDSMFGSGIIKEVLNEIDVTDKTYCFPEWHRTFIDPKTRSKASVYFSRICERLEIYDRSFHCLRHTFITRLAKAGVSLEKIGKAVGHSSTKTTEGYVHD